MILSAINNTINQLGTSVTVYNYLSTITFDEDTQDPTRSSTSSTQVAIIMAVTSKEVSNLAGIIDVNTRKFVFSSSVTINKGDDIVVGGLRYKVNELAQPYGKKIAYCKEYVEDGY